MRVLDLCCGLGGWVVSGHRFIGVDVRRFPYPGELILADVRNFDGRRFQSFDLIVASPPCNEFTQAKRFHGITIDPDLSIVRACFRIAKESGVPIVLENVRDARRWLGPSVCHRGSFYLWGDVPILPQMKIPPKIGGSWTKTRPSYSKRGWADKKSPEERARIPPVPARAVMRAFSERSPR